MGEEQQKGLGKRTKRKSFRLAFILWIIVFHKFPHLIPTYWIIESTLFYYTQYTLIN